MSLLSRYYVKSRIQQQLVENIQEENGCDDMDGLFNEISAIKSTIIAAEEETSRIMTGFFESAGYSY